MTMIETVDRRIPGTDPLVVALHDPAAAESELTGAKAAALARAAARGLPVLAGMVVTTDAFVRPERNVEPELERAWSTMSDGGRRPVVVRSSSTIEDNAASSMAGMFTSVLDVTSWEGFRMALDTVLASSNVVALTGPEARSRVRAPMAVLVQPQLAAVVGGVLFGLDPVSGRRDRLVVSASEAGPSAVVSGEVDGTRYVLSRRGRRLEGPPPARDRSPPPSSGNWPTSPAGRRRSSADPRTSSGPSGPTVGCGCSRAVPSPPPPPTRSTPAVPSSARVRWRRRSPTPCRPWRRTCGSPRSGTACGRPSPWPAPPPSGAWPPRPWSPPPVAGWRPTSSCWARPTAPPRCSAASTPGLPPAGWSPPGGSGRLRAALPALADDLLAAADRDLLDVPALDTLSDRELLGLLGRTATALASLHGHEVLMGWLVTSSANATATTAASVALRALAAARADGLSDDDIVAAYPGVLALVPPRIGSATVLPPTVPGLGVVNGDESIRGTEPDRAAVLREALRLRARWVQELTAKAAEELGRRLRDKGVLAAAEQVRHLRLDQLTTAVQRGRLPEGIDLERPAVAVGAPLPTRFRLTETAAVVPVTARTHRSRRHGGRAGAGAGAPAPAPAAVGAWDPSTSATIPPLAGSVLVVRTLDPGLASVLPGLGGLVAETGSFLSHLAILARELGVPTVVGVEDALTRFPAGTVVVVDGTTGEVSRRADENERGAA